MKNSYINNLEKKLLDIGKRNQLINYRSRLSSTLDFYFDDIYSLYDSFINGNKFIVAKLFNNLDEDILLSEIEDDLTDPYNVRETVTNACGVMTTRKDKYDLEEIGEILTRFKKKKDKEYLYPLSLYTRATSALSLLKRKSKLLREENGVDSLFMCFNFFRYKEQKEEYIAPVALIPVKINKDYKGEYTIEALDDDFVVNENFCQYIKLTYKLDIKRFLDESILEYTLRLKKMLKDINIDIFEKVSLSIFSFSKIVMYNDIKNNEERVLSNKFVKLFSGENINLLENNENFSPSIVVPADSSQMEAIKFATSGNSFVLQGPPGTGKSQTITNIISSLIEQGKKVLFVCEKQSALEVVYNNLVKSKLDLYALPIYDNKANKKEVIQNIYKNVEMLPNLSLKLSNNGKKVIDDYKSCLAFFDKYNSYLTKVTDIGLSLYELINLSLEGKHLLNFSFDNILSLSKKDYDNLCQRIHILSNSLNILNYSPLEHPYFGFKLNKISKDELTNLNKIISSLTLNLEKINRTYLEINKDVLLPKNIFSLNDSIDLLSILTNKYDLKILDFNKKNLDKCLSNLLTIKKLYKQLDSDKDYILKKYDESIFNIDVKSDFAVLEEKYSNVVKRMFGYSKYESKYTSLLKNKDTLNYDILKKDLNTIINLEKINLEIEELSISLRTNFKRFYFGSKTDFTLLEDIIKYLIKFNLIIEKIGIDKKGEICNIILENNSYDSYINNLIMYNDNIKEDLNSILNYFDFNSLDLPISSLLIKFKNILLDSESIFKYLDFRKDVLKLDLSIQNLIYSPSLTISTFESDFNASFAQCYLDNLKLDKNVSSSISEIENYLSNFKDLTDKQFEISKINISDKVTSLWPRFNGISSNNLEVSILKRELEKKRKLMTVRELFFNMPTLIQSLKPVMIMSPLSVAQYLDSSKFHFDCVIFDEASQMTEENAIGSIYRSDQLIVVGDKEQLAPTSFFDAQIEDEEDCDLVYESILNKASTLMPNIMLKWHYRSKYESLITYSNNNIYKNLYTFPANKSEGENGLNYIYVENGKYEHKKCINLEEANRVVDLVFYTFRHKPSKSVGVVTFNMSQENLIYRLIESRRKKDKTYESFFSEDVKEPFFIKNLETVQGDERDIIILSTTFGPDEQNKQSSNFGPINKENGYKRLNVAITRAKERMVVVSSIDLSRFSKSNLENKGVSMLVGFLNYSKNKDLINTNTTEISPYLNYIKNKFSSLGFDTTTNLGNNKFKIDLAIKDKSSLEYTCAIILENGKSLFESSLDKYYNVDNVLKSRGFKVFHIFLNLDLNQIDNQIDSIVSKIGKVETKIKVEESLSEAKEEVLLDVLSLFDPYPNILSIFDEEALKDITLEEKILNVINKISPVKESELIDLCAKHFATSKDEVKGIILHLKENRKIYIIIKFVLTIKDVMNPRFRRFDELNPYNRDISEVYIEELEAGFNLVIDYVKQTSKQILFKTFNKLLGYPKDSKVCVDTFNRALSNLIDKDLIELSSDIIIKK